MNNERKQAARGEAAALLADLAQRQREGHQRTLGNDRPLGMMTLEEAAQEERIARLEAITAPSKQSKAQTARRQGEREAILSVALACLWHFKPERNSITALAELIEQKAPIFWPETGSPPLGRDRLERLLRDAVKLPDK